ncbi:MAG: class I SAM-dependent methyltransferase [Eubacteriaceae bacterium]|jgi:tRNA (adenine22-N1)-methyltransferase|nr:class I SAM-dependent methyltransferase [Eubacteriaceae bacterium]
MRTIHLSARLAAIAAFVGKARVFADVGSDHAYLPLWMLINSKTERVIAIDAKKGPLENGRANAVYFGLEDKCDFRFGCGLGPLSEGEADCVCIAGLGGAAIIRILEEAGDKAKSFPSLVLGPQSLGDEVRLFLAEKGYGVAQSDYVQDGHIFYPILRIESASPAQNLTEEEAVFPIRPALEGSERYRSYLLHRKRELEKALGSLRHAKSPDKVAIASKQAKLMAVDERLALYNR